MSNIVINNTALQVIEYRGYRVATLSQIDEVHGRPNGTAGRNFREHKHRFIEGQDFFEIDQPDEIRRLGFERPQGGTPNKVILMTEQGYTMVVKAFTDDLSWKIQRQLVNDYFRTKTQVRELSKLEVLQQALESEQARIKAEEALALAAPKVNFFDKVVERSTLMTATQIAQKLGMSAIKLNQHLDELGFYGMGVKRARVFKQWVIDKGLGELKQTELGYSQPLFTTAGEAWIVERLTSEGVA
ncbi:ORF6N domain-containing protein [Comamonas sp. NoAH]|uniref:ORF6N domain-containing protein n=1 Tax=Comamonas halotolerans TaxID=3041496 RepID=UPI0024E05D64|nr:ORF6N domain-containing protein [Comamonas sp. NoAH]